MQREKVYSTKYYEKNINTYKEYYKKNRQKIIARSKRHYQENIDLKKLYNQMYYEENRDRLLEKAMEQNFVYYFKNKHGYMFTIKLNKPVKYKPDNKLIVCFD
jgi:hypothetical protein